MYIYGHHPENAQSSRREFTMNDVLSILWLLILLQAFVPLLQKRLLLARRQMAIRAIEVRRKSRVITMIHRQETMSLLGFPIARYIDIEDSERVLRAIRLTPPEMPIDLVLHTPGGLVLAAEQIACALKRHPGEVTVFVPHYALSGGTLIALAADRIVMDPNAVLGPVDPQLGGPQGSYYPAASILKALEQPKYTPQPGRPYVDPGRRGPQSDPSGLRDGLRADPGQNARRTGAGGRPRAQ
jgi:ClpP class serine protease